MSSTKRPPDEKRTLAALQAVQGLSPSELDARITARIGDHTLGVMSALAGAQLGTKDKEVVARGVHLMVLSWLLCEELRT